jgi:hypothetical protein
LDLSGKLDSLYSQLTHTKQLKKEAKRAIKRLEGTLNQQERSENLDQARDRWKAVHAEVKALKVELKMQREKMHLRQVSIDKQTEEINKIHNVSGIIVSDWFIVDG